MESVSSSDSSQVQHLQRALNELEEQKRYEAKRMTKLREDEAEQLSKNYKEAIAKKEEDTNRTIQNMQESQAESLRGERERYQAELDKLKNPNYNNRGEVLTVPKNVHDEQIEQLTKLLEQRKLNDQKTYDELRENYRENLREIDQKSKNDIQTTIDGNVRDIRDKDETIKDLTVYNQKLAHAKAEFLSEKEKEYRDGIKSEARRLTEAYEADLNNLRRTLNEQSDYYSRLHREILTDKEQHFADTVRENNLENRENMRSLESIYKEKLERMEEQERKLEDSHSENVAKIRRNADEDRNRSLENQARAYSSSYETMKQSDDEKIATLSKSLQQQRTSGDTSLISPAAESSIRNSVIREYEKTLGQEIDKNKLKLEDKENRYRSFYEDALTEFEDQTTSNNQENLLERLQEKKLFSEAMRETDFSARTQLREQETTHEREVNQLYKQFGTMMNRQRREYENLLESTRFDASVRLSNYREEAEAKFTDAIREQKARENLLVRDYEKKLSDQKREYEVVIDEIKMQAQNEARTAEKRARQDMDIQAKGYEQRLAQMEARTKERERSIAQNYADELEKTKRSYELLAQKKS